MTQLIYPDLNTVGNVGWCLQFVENAYSTPHLGATATDAWQSTEYPRYDALPDAQVPIWFSYYEDDVNFGHVAIWVPGRGVLSSPYKQDGTQQWFTDIAQCEHILNCKYLGWSEDIATIRVVEGDGMDKQQATYLAQRIGLLGAMSEAQITTEWLEYQSTHIMADVNYAAGLCKQIYDSHDWQLFAYKGTHYDEAVAAAASTNYTPVTEQLYKKGTTK